MTTRIAEVLRIHEVSKSYGAAKALDRVSLEVDEGERVVILGPSGCGKTTVLRLVAGFTAPDSGSIYISGELVSKDSKILKQPEDRQVGMVFQDMALWPHMSVRGNIEFGLKARGFSREERKERLRQALELVKMAEYESRRPSELSGGQQQRVALARALALEPRVLLMDEPLSSLDLELNLNLRKEILGLHERLKFTMLYVTHDREEAADIATRVVRMNRGRIEQVLD